MRTIELVLLSGLLAPGFAHAMDCATTTVAQPLRPTALAPIASELALTGNSPASSNGMLSQNGDESQSVDQVLLRIRTESCIASISPGNPAGYKPLTKFDNTPWRFNMSQNGKKMTADDFTAWMKSRGVRVARGAVAPVPVVPAQDGALPAASTPPPSVLPPQTPPIENSLHP